MVLTRSARKTRDTQWARDAVFDNSDLLCHIAQQTNLPTACNLLTTSKWNFVGCKDLFEDHDLGLSQYELAVNIDDFRPWKVKTLMTTLGRLKPWVGYPWVG